MKYCDKNNKMLTSDKEKAVLKYFGIDISRKKAELNILSCWYYPDLLTYTILHVGFAILDPCLFSRIFHVPWIFTSFVVAKTKKKIKMCPFFSFSISMTWHECHCVWNHCQCDRSFNSLLMLTIKKTQNHHITGALWQESICSPWKHLTKGK